MKLTDSDRKALGKIARSTHNTCRVSPCKKYYPDHYVHPSTGRRLVRLELATIDRQYSVRLYDRPHLFIHLTEAGRKALATDADSVR